MRVRGLLTPESGGRRSRRLAATGALGAVGFGLFNILTPSGSAAEGGDGAAREAAAHNLGVVVNELYVVGPGTVFRYTPDWQNPTETDPGNIALILDQPSFLGRGGMHAIVRAPLKVNESGSWMAALLSSDSKDVAEEKAVFSERLLYFEVANKQVANMWSLRERPLTDPRYMESDVFPARVEDYSIRVDIDEKRIDPGRLAVITLFEGKEICNVVAAMGGVHDNTLAYCN